MLQTKSAALQHTAVPRRQKHYSYDESLDESGKLIADEPAEIETETPMEERESIERIESEQPREPPAFEE
jgi:hypothetical protein